MEEIISYCGLVCGTCPIHLASLETDIAKKNEMILTIIKTCKEEYNMDFNPSDITDCDGCMSTSGRLFSACVNCKIRSCAISKSVANCAYCSDYICNNLNAFFKTDPSAKIRLDEIRNSL